MNEGQNVELRNVECRSVESGKANVECRREAGETPAVRGVGRGWRGWG